MDDNSTLDENEFLVLFGKRVRQLRKAKGMTQEIVATKAGFKRSYYGEIETGKRNISLLNLYKLASSLDVSLSTLFDFTPLDSE